ncbi:cyclase family protein [Streptomyces sp. NPDC059175]|uniref:cyclase family protein n=1 Tax=Streptomyces sp. NPDC059175 TaxID=3346757 RepID=UPI0036AA0E50
MRVIDLSSPVDASFWEPDPVRHTAMSPAEGARHMVSEMREHFGLDLDVSMLPGGEFLNNDTLTLTTHTGTHVDAPAHYGSTASYRASGPRTVDELPLEWFYGPAFVLDISDVVGRGTVDASRIADECAKISYSPAPGDIALLHTGADQHVGTPEYFTDFVGLDRSAVAYLLDLGIRVIGTDAFSLDAPFTHILTEYERTRDHRVLWPAHFIGREREYCQIERLANLTVLPKTSGFRLSCFPVKVARAGAGWARAVALLDE